MQSELDGSEVKFCEVSGTKLLVQEVFGVDLYLFVMTLFGSHSWIEGWLKFWQKFNFGHWPRVRVMFGAENWSRSVIWTSNLVLLENTVNGVSFLANAPSYHLFLYYVTSEVVGGTKSHKKQISMLCRSNESVTAIITGCHEYIQQGVILCAEKGSLYTESSSGPKT